MKILTIASPRSGGLYFTKSLADTYRLFHYHEPDFDEFDYILKRRKGVSIKIHVEQLHKYYNKPTIDELDDVIDRIYNDVSKHNFDKIFLLDRRNVIEHAEAMINILYHKKDMNVKWSSDDEEFIQLRNSKKYDYMIEYSKSVSMWLDKLSDKFNIPKMYYEDLYYNTSIVDLQGLEFKPDVTKKLRDSGSTKII